MMLFSFTLFILLVNINTYYEYLYVQKYSMWLYIVRKIFIVIMNIHIVQKIFNVIIYIVKIFNVIIYIVHIVLKYSM